jgi:peroxiredoxin/predicted Zn-dependent protease
MKTTGNLLLLKLFLLVVIVSFVFSGFSSCSRSSHDPLAAQSALLKKGKKSISELLAEYRSMIDKNPTDPLGYVLAGNIFLRDDSRVYYEKALSLSPEYGPAHFGLARYFVRYGDKTKALEEFKKALASLPKNQELRSESIRAAVAASKIEEAEKIAGKNPHLRQEIVNALIDEGQTSEAEKAMSAYGIDSEAKVFSLYLRGRILCAIGEKEKKQDMVNQGIEALLDSWRKDPSQPFHYQYIYPRKPLTLLLSRSRRYKELKEVLEEGLKRHPEYYWLYPELWKISFAEVRDDYELIRKDVFVKAESLLKNNPSSPVLYAAVMQGYRMADKPEQLEKIQNALLKEFPFSPQAETVRKSLVAQEKDLAKKMILYEKFVQDFPDWPYAYQGYFKTALELDVPDEKLLEVAEAFLIKDKGDHSLYAVVESFLKKRIYLGRVEKWLAESGKSPDLIENSWDVRILNLKAKLLLLQGKADEAEKILDRLMNLEIAGLSNVDKGRIQFCLAEVYETRKKFPEALDLYAQAYAQSQHYLKEAGDQFGRLYLQIHGDDKGMEKYLGSRDKTYQSLEGVGSIGIERGTKIDEPAPDFELKSLDRKIVRLSSFRGKVVILNFWATWCGPCNQELPHLQELYEKMKNDDGVAILTITSDENRALVEPFVRRKKYTFPVLYDEGVRSKYGVRGIPSTFIIDPMGTIRLRMVGYNQNEPLVPYLEKVIEQYRLRRQGQ